MIKKIIIGFAVLVILLIGGVVFYIFLKPQEVKLTDVQKQEALTKLLGRKVDFKEKEIVQGEIEYKGKYASFMYPKRAQIQDYSNSGYENLPRGLESLSLIFRQPSMLFNYVVNGVDIRFVNSINDDASVLMRHRSPGSYEEMAQKIGGVDGLIYKKSGRDAEKSGFLFHNGRIYSFAVTGTSIDDVSEVFDNLIKTVKLLD